MKERVYGSRRGYQSKPAKKQLITTTTYLNTPPSSLLLNRHRRLRNLAGLRVRQVAHARHIRHARSRFPIILDNERLRRMFSLCRRPHRFAFRLVAKDGIGVVLLVDGGCGAGARGLALFGGEAVFFEACFAAALVAVPEDEEEDCEMLVLHIKDKG